MQMMRDSRTYLQSNWSDKYSYWSGPRICAEPQGKVADFFMFGGITITLSASDARVSDNYLTPVCP